MMLAGPPPLPEMNLWRGFIHKMGVRKPAWSQIKGGRAEVAVADMMSEAFTVPGCCFCLSIFDPMHCQVPVLYFK